MAWATPRTWATSDALSAAALNQDIRDNLLFLANLPRSRVYAESDVSIANTTWTSVTFDRERTDPGGLHSVATNTSRLTIVTTGWYEINGGFDFASNATGYRGIRVLLNGATQLVKKLLPAVNGDATGLQISTEYALTAGDYVELQAYQNSGGALNISAIPNYSPEFTATLQTGF